jgi:hypothetical protein
MPAGHPAQTSNHPRTSPAFAKAQPDCTLESGS